MLASIITIGDEILYGRTVDTNSAWMGRALSDIGIRVNDIRSIADDKQDILNALAAVPANVQLVLITGGLGPTKDDITKLTLAEYFGTKLVMNNEILSLLEEYFSKRGRPMLQVNRDQALMPEACTPLRNDRGTAWGMWFEKNGKVFVSMPGVPREMVALMEQEVLPRVKAQFDLPIIIHQHLLAAGIGESYIAEKIADLEDSLPPEIKLAYLPDLGKVKLRLTARGTDREHLETLLQEQVTAFSERIGRYIYGHNEDRFEAAVGKILLEQGKTISTAESCTGGLISSMLTSIPGSSKYFEGGVVSYSYQAKEDLLGVSAETITTHGAVSEEVVTEMVIGACKTLKTDVAIAVSGIAGPSGGTEDKPVGTVWVAVGSPDRIVTRKYQFPADRQHNVELSTVMALELMRKYLIGLV